MLNNQILIILLVALPWLILVFLKPKLLLGITLVLSAFQLNWFYRYMGSAAVVTRIALGFVGVLAIRIVLDVLSSKRLRIFRRGFLSSAVYLAFAFVLLTIISCVYNGENLLLGIFTLRYYFAGFVICFGLYIYYGKKLSIIHLKRVVIYLGLLQIPASIVKFLVAGGGELRSLDSVTGTFSSYGELIACQIIGIGLLLYERFHRGRNILRWNSFVLAPILTIPLLLSKSRAATAFVLFMILFAWGLSTIRKKNLGLSIWNMLLMVVIGGIALALFYQFFWLGTYDIEQQTDPEYIREYFMRGPVEGHERMGRWRSIIASVSFITDNPANFMLGYGSGSTAEASMINKQGNYYQEAGPLAGLGGSQYSRQIMEFGFLGIIFFGLFLYRTYRRIPTIRSPAANMTVDFYLTMIYALVILSWYTVTLASYFFSMLFGAFLAVAQRELDRSKESAEPQLPSSTGVPD